MKLPVFSAWAEAGSIPKGVDVLQVMEVLDVRREIRRQDRLGVNIERAGQVLAWLWEYAGQ